MESLKIMYGSDSDESESEGSPPASGGGGEGYRRNLKRKEPGELPPPPLELLHHPNDLGFSITAQGTRIRSFAHVEGNYALHVSVPVHIPPAAWKELALAMKKVTSLVPSLYVVDSDVALSEICKDDQKIEKLLLGKEFHISLGRTVPIKVHQIASLVSMLRQKFQSHKRYSIEFNKWEFFVNDDNTRSFLSLEVIGGGLSEISQQIHLVDNVYRLHGLPEFYKNPRPHISLVWALGDVSSELKQAAKEVNKFHERLSSSSRPVFICQFSGIECKIGKKLYTIF